MPQRWGTWFAVAGDLRFLSHHDTMRMMERAAARAELPLRYTGGFNPRPMVSLVCPRPVGVATRDDLLVVWLAEPMPGEEILRRLNGQAPRGMEFSGAGTLPGKVTPRARRAEYELELAPDEASAVRARLDDLSRREAWPIQRRTSAGRRRRRGPATVRALDLKPLVAEAACRDRTLRWALVPRGDQWGRPGELLALLDLDPRVDLADVVRTAVQYDPQPNTSPDPEDDPAPAGL